MIRDEIIDWLVFAVMGCAAVAAAAAVVCVEGPTEGERAEAERRERIEWRCWCEEWADVRAAQERFLERRGR